MTSSDKVFKNEYGDFLSLKSKTKWLIRNKRVVEIEEMEGFEHKRIWGITVIDVISLSPLRTRKRLDLSNIAYSKEELNRYIWKLKKWRRRNESIT